MSSLLRIFRSKLDSYPCIILLAGILSGFSAVWFSGSALTAGSIFLWATPGLLAAWFLFGLRSSCFRFIPATCLAVISSLLLIARSETQFQNQEMSSFDRLGATAVFRLTDPSLCGGEPDWIPNTPYYVQAELQSVCIGEPEEMRPVREKVLLTFSLVPARFRNSVTVI